MRWLSELKNPKLKCERLGHKERTHTVKGYIKPYHKAAQYHFNSVASRAIKESIYCKRCKEVLNSTIIDKGGINSLSLNSDIYDELNDKHEVWLN